LTDAIEHGTVCGMWDCIVVGGGAAGLSAALVLGRARRGTLLIDQGDQSNLAAHGIGGLLGHDGRPPAELYAAGREELAAYPSVEVRSGEVVGAERRAAGFEIEVAGGGREQARRLLLATGMEYRFPDLAGIAERWGRSVFHCPFCHGWEVRERPLGVLDRGSSGVRRALLLSSWSDEVTLLPDGPAELEPGDAQRLEAAGVDVDDRIVAGLCGAAPDLTAVAFEDGSERPFHGLLVPITLHQRSGIAARLGAAMAAREPMTTDAIETDAGFQTSVPGLYAAGDVNVQMPSVASAIAAGSAAAAVIVHDLTEAG
jgi:thioredoxin reductase